MPKKRDPTMMETLQRQSLIEEQKLKAAPKQKLSPAKGVEKGMRVKRPQ